MSRVTTAIDQAAQYRDSYNEHAYLWVDDRKEFLSQFLKYGHVITQVSAPPLMMKTGVLFGLTGSNYSSNLYRHCRRRLTRLGTRGCLRNHPL